MDTLIIIRTSDECITFINVNSIEYVDIDDKHPHVEFRGHDWVLVFAGSDAKKAKASWQNYLASVTQ